MIKIFNLRGNLKNFVCDYGGGGIFWWEYIVDVSYYDVFEEGNNENNFVGWVVVE